MSTKNATAVGAVFDQPSFNWNSKNLYAEWKRFYMVCENIFESFYDDLGEKKQSGLLLTWMEPSKALPVVKELIPEKNDRYKLKS
jgi:hypothetical protein